MYKCHTSQVKKGVFHIAPNMHCTQFTYTVLKSDWAKQGIIGAYLVSSTCRDEIESEIRKSRIEYLIEQHNLRLDERGFIHFPEHSLQSV